ncbi:MAG: IPTL-CTERM sorting domain-containing protein, partial [Synechococcaceae bacterium WB9_2_112]|nr:IPTL-CTERM sorting domain-containing protein [Synechococcaceae bacterium WB9_2_112]
MPATFTGSYSQNFDALASTGTNIVWSNDVTLPGWHLFRQPATAPAAITAYNADPGTSTTGSFYSYGASGSSERALGGLGAGGTYFGSPSSGSLAGWFALALTNTTGAAVTGITVDFRGEQWRNGGNTATQVMLLEYGYGASFDQVTTWTAPGGNFNWASPVVSSTAGAVDGNVAGLVANRGGSLDLSSTPWATNGTLWLRWIETNDAGNDHGLAIDDLTITLPQATVQPEISIQAIDASASESGDGATVRISRSGSTTAALQVPVALVAGTGLATAADLSTALPTSVTIAAGASSVDLPISVLDDALDEGTEILRLQITAPAGTLIASSGASADITIFDNDRLTRISAVQGSGSTSPQVGQNVTLRAVVVGDFQLSSELGGFYLQEETADWDASSLTSEGLYVAYPLSGSNINVTIGDRVLLNGTVGERFGQTAITSVNALAVEAQGRLGDTSRVDIPNLLAQRSSSVDLEPYEGMWVRFPETLTVNGLYGQFRYGELELSAGGLPQQP